MDNARCGARGTEQTRVANKMLPGGEPASLGNHRGAPANASVSILPYERREDLVTRERVNDLDNAVDDCRQADNPPQRDCRIDRGEDDDEASQD